MNWRTCSAALAALALIVTATACGAGQGQGSASGTKQLTIGVAFPSLENSYLVTVKNAIDAEAQKQGAKVLFQAPRASADTEQAINNLNNLTAQQPDVIIAFVTGGAPLVPALKQAAKVAPVILIDGDLPQFTERTSFIGTDNAGAAALAGKYLVANLKSGTVGILAGTPGNPTHQQRVDGFTAALQGSGISVVSTLRTDCDAVKGRSATEDMLTAHPDVSAIFGICDEPIDGAVQALHARSGAHPMVLGFDASCPNLKNVQSGVETAEVAQFPVKEAQLAVQNALKVARGEKIPPRIDSGEELVTKDNVASFITDRC